MFHAVIMAGGSGTRFWPESRRLSPKQLLRLVGDRTMIQATVDRLAGLVPPERQMVVTNQNLVEAIAAQLPALRRENILGEPCKRDTAPCVGLAAALLHARDPDATMVMLPADHVIAPVERFQSAIEEGLRWIEDDPQRLVTFGIRPTYPAESFGYIERGAALGNPSGSPSRCQAFQVARFREKPSREKAQEFLAAGNFDWNSGIFLWRASTILEALARFEPEMEAHLRKIAAAIETPAFPATLADHFAAITPKSIDYAVMENYEKIVVIEAPFQWDDLGSWQALARMIPADAAGNAVDGNHLGIETSGCIVRTTANHTIVTIDLHDLVLVQTPDATLVAPRSAEERVREIVRLIETQGPESLL